MNMNMYLCVLGNHGNRHTPSILHIDVTYFTDIGVASHCLWFHVLYIPIHWYRW